MISTIKKELSEIRNDHIMVAVLIGFPIFVMLFMGSSFGKVEISGLPVGYSGPTETGYGAMIISSLNSSKAFSIVILNDSNEGIEQLRNGRIKALISAPIDLENQIQQGKGSSINLTIDNSDIALEQSILAVISSVLQASSSNITRNYVNLAWADLYRLNTSAGSISASIQEGRQRLLGTKQQIQTINQNMSDLDLDRLDSSLENAINGSQQLHQKSIELQNNLNNNSQNQGLLENTSAFINDTRSSLQDAMITLDSTHSRLENQSAELNQTIAELDVSISSANVIHSQVQNSSCNVTAPAVSLIITGLERMRSNTQSQLHDLNEQLVELESLNTSLNQYNSRLDEFENMISDASNQNDQSDMIRELQGLQTISQNMTDSFVAARTQVQRLKTLITSIRQTINEVDQTIDNSLAQTDQVSELIISLQQTVNAQTSKDPSKIAIPLSVSVQAQYERQSFVDFIIPQVISVSLLFSCLLLASISTVRERTRGTLIRLMLIPNGLAESMIGKIVCVAVLGVLQIGIIITVGVLVFGVKVPENMAVVVGGGLIATLVLSSLGAIIGLITKNESAAIQTTLIIGIPMLFLGNIVFSADLLPKYTQTIQELLPLAHITNIFKLALITGGDPTADIVALFGYFVLLGAVIAYLVWRKKEIER